MWYMVEEAARMTWLGNAWWDGRRWQEQGKGKLEKGKRKQHQWGEIKNSCVKEEQMEWSFFFFFFLRINLKSEKVPGDAD